MKIGCAALVLLLPGAAAAGEALPGTVVTASRTGAASVTVIEAADIERLQPATLLEALDRAAGVRAFSKGGVGGTSYLSLQGGEPNYTLVLLDGVRLNDPTNSQGGSFDFSQVAPAAIERIEIASGGLSAVHGADALSGAVQMRLRTPVRSEQSVSIGAGGDSERGVWSDASAAYGWRGGGLLASASWYDSGDLTEGSDLARGQILAKLAHETGPIALSAFVLHADTSRSAFPEDSGGPRLAIVRELERRDTQFTAVALDASAGASSDVLPHVALRWTRQASDVATPAIAPGVYDGVPAVRSDSRFERIDLLADVRTSLGASTTLAVGAEYIAERGRSDAAVDIGFPLPADFDIDRSIGSAFAEATLVPSERVAVTGGVRVDAASGLDPRWSGRGRVAVRASEGGPLLFAAASQGFKLPSLFALAFPLIANPALRPERGTSVEAGVELALGTPGYLRLSGFNNRFRDMIDFDPQLFTNVNREQVVTRGVSATVAWQPLHALFLDANVTYTDVTSATPLRSRPTWQGAVALTWRVRPEVAINLGGRFISSSFDSSVPTGLVRADGHFEVDLGARWQFGAKLVVDVVARNLFDAEYEDAVGFPAPGRLVRAAARIDL